MAPPTRSPKVTQKRARIAADYLSGAGSAREIAAQYGVDHVTVLNAKNDPEAVAAAQPFLARIELKLESLAEKLVARYLEIADGADFTDKSTTALGIVLDKLLLLKGQATQITETRQGLSAEAQEYLRSLIARAREQGETDELIRANVAAKWPEAVEHLGQVM